MDESIYNDIVAVISTCSFWIRVRCADGVVPYVETVGGRLCFFMVPCLTLVAVRPHGTFGEGHEWNIPKCDLHRAIRQLMAEDRDFRERAKRHSIVSYDVDRIVLRATSGVLHLDLSDPYSAITGCTL